MKYAKLKKGIIFDLEHLWKDMNENYCFGLGYKPVIYKEDIIKESDNLEDLFDAIVDYKEDRSRLYYTYDVDDFGIMRRLNHNDKNATFYGAIWTDKGLIYVARMNKDGEWELI